MTNTKLTRGQELARDEIKAIATAHAASLTVLEVRPVGPDRQLRIVVRLPTRDLEHAPDGLVTNEFEDVVIAVGPNYPVQPPTASVEHPRFINATHVLQGERICVFLDPSREWHPRDGMAGFLEALWNWFADAVGNRFDPTTALYHAVGGVLHRSAGTPTVVIRDPLPLPAKAYRRAILRQRTPARFDVDWSERNRAEDEVHAAVIALRERLPLGAGLSLPALVTALNLYGHLDDAAVLRFLATTAARNPTGTPLYFIVVVDHPSASAHLLSGRLPVPTADHLRTLSARHGPLLDLNASQIPDETEVQWCTTSDERVAVATRRDGNRPVASLAGRCIHVWGCGGLGSWIAEFAVRAGAARVVLCDPAPAIPGGLLVRQNFTEDDIGTSKVAALAKRLRNISDRVEVESFESGLPTSLDALPQADLIIDATVSVAIGWVIDGLVASAKAHPTIATVATDVATGTLGLIVISAASSTAGPAKLDEEVRVKVLARGDLEQFHTFWNTPAKKDEVNPLPGCSVPTFHGSAADMASLAGTMLSLLEPHLDTRISAVHLLALPHAPGGPAHEVIVA